MKSLLVTGHSALVCLVLTSIAAAQDLQLPNGPAQAAPNSALPQLPGTAQTAPAATSESAPLSVAEAKKRYLEKQKSLKELAKDVSLGWTELPLRQLNARLEIELQAPRDRIRAAVTEAFDARRQLQQAELAELEDRITRIKRALEIRDAMRDTIIDQRTDELLDEMEEAGKPDKRKEAARPGGGRTVSGGANKDGAATPPGEPDADAIQREAQLIKLDIAKAKAILDSAERAYERVQRLHASGAVSQEGLDEASLKQHVARMQLDRAVVKWDEFREAHRSALPAAKEPSAGDGAVNDQAKTPRITQLDLKEAEVDVQEAEANLSAAERAYDDAKKMRAKGLREDAVEASAIKYKRAQLQLERAKEKLKTLKEAAAADAAVDEQPKTQGVTQLGLKEAEVEVHEAEVNLSAAQQAYDYGKKMHAKGYVTDAALENPAVKYERAKLDLERAKAKLQALDRAPAGDGDDQPKTLSSYGPVDQSQIVWGSQDTDLLPLAEPSGSIQIGHLVEPQKAAYAPGDILTVKLFLKYTGEQRRKLAFPPSPTLERLGVDLLLRDAAGGEKLDWEWGPAHKEPARSGNVTMAFEPGAIKQFPEIKLVVGRAETLPSANDEPMVFAYLDVKPGQTARLRFKLASDLLRLESEPFELRVEEPVKKLRATDDPATDQAPGSSAARD
jgi:hypothetical protein